MTPDLAANAIVFALIQSLLFLLLIDFLDFYDRKPLSLLALLFVWGAVGATTISEFGNGALRDLLDYASPQVATVFGAALTAPLVEETAKGIAVVIVFALSYPITRRFGVRMFNGVTNGIVYGAAVGLGFSFAEDVFYFFKVADIEGLEQGFFTYLGRSYLFFPLVGQLGHGIMTGIFGAGLGLAVWSRSWIAKIFFPLLGLAVAMFMHAVHNGLVQLVLVLGFGLDAAAEALSAGDLPPEMEELGTIASLLMFLSNYIFAAVFFLVIWLWNRYQRRVIREELAEEVDAGLITKEEWEVAPRYWYRLLLYWRVLWSGKVEQWCALRRLYHELVDLALLKRRLRRTDGEWDQVERLRRRIKALESQEVVE